MEGPDLPSFWSHYWDSLGLISENKCFKCHCADWPGACRLPEGFKSSVSPQIGSHGGVCILYNFAQNIKFPLHAPGQSAWLQMKDLFSKMKSKQPHSDPRMIGDQGLPCTWALGINSHPHNMHTFQAYVTLYIICAQKTSVNMVCYISINEAWEQVRTL